MSRYVTLLSRSGGDPGFEPLPGYLGSSVALRPQGVLLVATEGSPYCGFKGIATRPDPAGRTCVTLHVTLCHALPVGLCRGVVVG